MLRVLKRAGLESLLNYRIAEISYDANGDVLSDSLHSYAWDMHGRPTTIDTATVTYDALGRMVEQTKSGTSTETEYSPTGFKLQLLNGQSSYLEQFTPLPGGTAKVWQGNGPDYYKHADWLGSSRFASTPSRTMYNDLAYAPFGEQYAAAGTTGITNVSFAGNNEDTTTNLYDAQFREYGIQGRWPSPDPAGIAAVDPSNPQSWNRYAYVLNNPLRAVDPTGLFCMWDDGSYDSADDPGNVDDPGFSGTPDACQGQGGTWLNGSPSDYGLSADWNPAGNPTMAGFINDFTNGQEGGSGGNATKNDYTNYAQNGTTQNLPLLPSLGQAGQMASPQNIFEIWGASIFAGAAPTIGSGIVDIGNLGYGWALENPDAAALLIDYLGGALSPTPGPFTPAGVTGNLAGCSLPTGNPAPYCPSNLLNNKH